MFLIKIIRWLTGWAVFEAEGGFPERLLNLAAAKRIRLWQTRRRGTMLTACCRARDYRQLRQLFRRTGMRAHIIKKNGMPFRLRPYRHRGGILCGALAYILILQFFSGRIWVVNLSGASEENRAAILAAMAEMGVLVGARYDELDLPEIQLRALAELDSVSWLAVNFNASVADIEVTEWDPEQQPPEPDTPSNLKASADGVILEMRITGGQGMVKPGDAVVKGMLLVSGVVESTVGPLLCRAEGVVLAKTRHVLTVTVPLVQQQRLPEQPPVYRPSLFFFGIRIPLYTDGEIAGDRDTGQWEQMLTLNRVKMPIGVTLEQIQPMALGQVTYTAGEAETLAFEELTGLERTLAENAEIEQTEIKLEEVDGCIRLTGIYICVENIASEEKIQLADIDS
ncbi:MAG: sporulation protein YqfD [Oscillospiraceae bacterium]|nr:sporulation protein YqfD [Oscillospiraceae bacterium]